MTKTWTPFVLLPLMALSTSAFAQDKKLPPSNTPPAILHNTPPPAAAKAQIDVLHTINPKAFYSKPENPEQYLSEVEILARNQYEKDQGYHFDKIIRGNPKSREIALTFDDGPHEPYTLQLLNILQKLHVHATFFVVGKQVEKFPVLVQLEVIEGHEVGDHTYDHVNLTKIPPPLIGYELSECDRAIKKYTGASVRYFRPPGGDYNGDVIQEAARLNYVTTLWTDDPGDYANPGAATILNRTLDHLEPGAILLLHDGIPETMQILPELVSEARRRGYEFVTISQLAKDRESE